MRPPWRQQRRDSGQALVESAIVMPLMVFLILGIVQLTMVQHARLMTEYAAFSAARAGSVWNADKHTMENAAIIALLPTYGGLFDESSAGNPNRMLQQIMARALLYQVHRQLPAAIDSIQNGVGGAIGGLGLPGGAGDSLTRDANDLIRRAGESADADLERSISGALGGSGDQLVSIKIVEPKLAWFGSPGAGGTPNYEIDFDDPANRDHTRLSIEVTYLYYMRVPFANWIIHQAWLAQELSKRLYGAIWAPRVASSDAAGHTRWFRGADEPAVNLSGGNDAAVRASVRLSEMDHPVYVIPLRATYTMRMQSNPYRISIQ